MSPKHKQTRKDRREAAQAGETTVVTSADVGSVTAVIGGNDSVVGEPAGETVAPVEQAPVAEAAPVAEVAPENSVVNAKSFGEILGLTAAAAPEKAAVVIAAKGEQTRHQPMKLNFGFKEKGERTGKNKGISNGARLFRVGKGNGSGENTVWGHCLTVAKRLGDASQDGTFTAQQLYNALYETDWLGSGVTRPKYTPANGVAYAGWIHDLVKGAPSKSFGIVVAIAKEEKAAE